MEELEKQPGFLIALEVAAAKRVFACRDDESLGALVDELLASAELRPQGRLLQCDTRWAWLHRCLTGGTLEHTAGEPPINHAILGGRPLFHGAGRLVVLVRPDMVPHVSAALTDLAGDAFCEKLDALPAVEHTKDELLSLLEAIRRFYAQASANRNAVLFVTSP